jgi:hypothetical protein
MKKRELTERLAAIGGVTPEVAADELDTAIHRVLKNLRKPGPSRPNALQRLIEQAQSTLENRGWRKAS